MIEENLVKGQTGDWEVVIGLEIHAQVKSNAKLFSGSATTFGAEPNTQVSLIDSAQPGMLPVLNFRCVEQAVKTGLAINAKINTTSIFDRKNYFYADLPQGYQITQFSDPIVGEGEMKINMPYGERVIGVERIHLEQDAGKSIHDQSPTESFIDLNRAGVALMEVVTKPDLTSADEAVEFVKKFRQIVRYVDSCDGDMEKGSMRCDANISVRKPGAELGTRNEIKNLNSFKFIAAAINYEIERQIELLESGGVVEQATRLFDTSSGITKVMRSKEEAHDYRYFPDPDLYPLKVSDEFIEEIRSKLPELPDAKKDRYINEFGLKEYDADVIAFDRSVAAYFDEVVDTTKDAKLSASWVSGELFGRLNNAKLSIADSPVDAKRLSDLIKLIKDSTISGKAAKDVLDEMFVSDKAAMDIVEEKGLKQVTDTGAIEAILDEVIANNEGQWEAFIGGKDKLKGFFVGQTMKASKGAANPQLVNELIDKKLK